MLVQRGSSHESSPHVNAHLSGIPARGLEQAKAADRNKKRPHRVRFDPLVDTCLFLAHQPPARVCGPIALLDVRPERDSGSKITSFSKAMRVRQEPHCLLDFLDEDTSIEEAPSPGDNVLLGDVMVYNIQYEKSVTIRLTFDNWQSYQDVPAVYRSSIGTQLVDKFRFKIALPNTPVDLEFAIAYRAGARTYWDNNGGQNYRYNCRLVPLAVASVAEYSIEPDQAAISQPISIPFRKYKGNLYDILLNDLTP